VNGRISSANSKTNKTLLPYSDLKANPAMGAQTTSVTSPRTGTSSEEDPITSIAIQSKSFPKSGWTDDAAGAPLHKRTIHNNEIDALNINHEIHSQV
jgi:hypothetical protein